MVLEGPSPPQKRLRPNISLQVKNVRWFALVGKRSEWGKKKKAETATHHSSAERPAATSAMRAASLPPLAPPSEPECASPAAALKLETRCLQNAPPAKQQAEKTPWKKAQDSSWEVDTCHGSERERS
jgi:hypothetical protein